MKFFESKYYTRKHREEQSGFGYSTADNLIREIAILRSTKFNGSWVKSMLDEYTQPLPPLKHYAINYAKILAEWELVEDMVCYSGLSADGYNEDTIDGHLDEVYFHPTLECFTLVRKKNGGEYLNTSSYSIRVPFLLKPNGIFKELIDREYITSEKQITEPSLNVLTHDKHGFSLSNSTLPTKEIDIEYMYSAGFQEVSDQIIEIVNSDDNTGLIILHGVPGSGKTSYIRWLTGQTKRKFVFIPADMVGQLSKPAFLEFLLQNKGLTFIVEDAEIALSPREGVTGSVVSTILNLTDGLLGDVLNCQFICTFNTELNQIDSALLRPGRLLLRHEFTNLTTEEANRYLNKYNPEYTVSDYTSLADVMNMSNPITSTEVTSKRGIGFISN